MKTFIILKKHCKNVYLMGAGNYWYEEGVIGDDTSLLYRVFQFVLFTLYISMTILETMAAALGDFPKDEKGDSVAFTVSHIIVMIKIFSVMRNKGLIKIMNKNMVKVCAEYEEKTLMADMSRIININVVAYFVNVYGSMLCFIFEGLRKKFQDGSHFVTVVTYYPSFCDNSLAATIFRISTTLILIMMLMTMIVSVDGYTMMYLIMLKYKIITLRHYLENLRKEFDRESKRDLRSASEELSNGLVKGIVMHSELIRMCKDIHKAFGTVMALQVCQSSGSAVSLLLQMALSKDLTFIASMKIIFFVIALFFLLALFLCNAGEITYQASLLSDAIFYCGWHACDAQAQRRMGRIVAFSVAQGQRPLVMKGFKMLELTYGTFLWVMRSTYSVFALFYAQNK
ncbi:uncharacterized protein LOC126371016 [Pectinophora gossypiella]|uniref:uncharacterized protein LOC126371016 n=1 Tax=Pectinophora gossypiella TaxID=13191 RepID=UPI00214E8BD2|nr:uncharacterized protein LOC126371016 [Pectinophora gossypiella]